MFVWASLDDFAISEPSVGAIVEADAAARPPAAPTTPLEMAVAWGNVVEWLGNEAVA